MGGRGGRLVAELRVEGGVWYGGCVQRIEGIVKCTLRCFTILRIINKSCRGGGGGGVGARFKPKTLSSYLAFILFEILHYCICKIAMSNVKIFKG